VAVGGVVGTAALGPVGGIVGAAVGHYVDENGGVSGAVDAATEAAANTGRSVFDSIRSAAGSTADFLRENASADDFARARQEAGENHDYGVPQSPYIPSDPDFNPPDDF